MQGVYKISKHCAVTWCTDNRVGAVRLAARSAGGLLGRATVARASDDAVCRAAQSASADQRGVVSRPFAGPRTQQRLLRQRADDQRSVESPRSPEGTHRFELYEWYGMV